MSCGSVLVETRNKVITIKNLYHLQNIFTAHMICFLSLFAFQMFQPVVHVQRRLKAELRRTRQAFVRASPRMGVHMVCQTFSYLQQH